MKELNLRTLNELAGKTLFIRDNLEKVVRLCDILEQLFSSAYQNKLVLKGGTAINLFYAGLPRLSVDIDLDYIGKTKEETLLDKEAIYAYVSGAFASKGYRLSSGSKRHYALDSLVLEYTNLAGNHDNVKIDINYLDRKHILPLNTMQIDVFDMQSETPIRVLAKEELYASKISALISRGKPRDLFDVYFALKNNVIQNDALLRKCVLFYDSIGGDLNAVHAQRFDFESLTWRDCQRMLFPLLQKKSDFHFENAIAAVAAFLRELFQFDENELKYAECFERKDYRPELLFGPSLEADAVEDHPVALWRMQNEK